MKLSRQLALVALLLPSLAIHGDDVITEVMSPIGSYHFAENYQTAALASDGLASPFLSYHYAEDFNNDSIAGGGAISPFVSFQYLENFSSSALVNGGIMSLIASYQYFEWPGDDILRLLSSPVASYYYQFSSTPGSVFVHGRVTDLSGMPLAGAIVSARVYLSPVAEASTDANGNYQLPSLGTGVYDLWAVKANYQTSIRAFTLGSSTTEQNFQLKPMPAAPVAQQTSRLPNLSAVVGVMDSELLVFDGAQFQSITFANAPAPDRMTIVLTHGWNSSAYEWAEDMAAEMWGKGVTRDKANIVAWNWEFAARRNLVPPEENIPAQGVALGQALLGTLGAGYSHPLHFIGHSLGAPVNGAAANYLHGDRTGQQETSPAPWNVPVHVTLLDEAASLLSPLSLFNGLTVRVRDASTVLPSAPELFGWKRPTPISLTWADNYVSLVGYRHRDTVTIELTKAPANPVAAHSYSHQWYRLTIGDPTHCILGFQESHEAKLVGISAFDFSEARINFPRGASYQQSATTTDPLFLAYKPSFSEAVGNVANTVVQGAEGTAEFVGNVALQVNDTAQTTSELISQSFGYVGDIAAQGGQASIDFFDTAVLHLKLTTAPAPSPLSGFGVLSPDDIATSNSPAMAWLPIRFPRNATAMAFDFIISGNPASDSLVCGIGTNNLFALEAKYIPTNMISASRLIDVMVWEGTTNELFFGLLGGTSTNATLEVENIRFYSLQSPQLSIQHAGGAVLLNWPRSANAYVLETSTSITATSEWSIIPDVPSLVDDHFVVTNEVSSGTRFYRLR